MPHAHRRFHRPPDRVDDKLGAVAAANGKAPPFQQTLLGLTEYPYSTNRPSLCCHLHAQPACLKFWRQNPTGNGNGGAPNGPPTCSGNGSGGAPNGPPTCCGNGIGGAPNGPPTCSGNGNDGASSTIRTGNRKEGALAHVFQNGARNQS